MYKNALNNSGGIICYLSATLGAGGEAASQAAAARVTVLSQCDMKGEHERKGKQISF